MLEDGQEDLAIWLGGCVGWTPLMHACEARDRGKVEATLSSCWDEEGQLEAQLQAVDSNGHVWGPLEAAKCPSKMRKALGPLVLPIDKDIAKEMKRATAEVKARSG